MEIEKIFLITGSLIFLVLGTVHLFYTFVSNKFLPRNPAAENEMKNTSPRLTGETTMWKAWIGFNASHSTGAMFFGFMNLFFAVFAFSVFEQSVLLQGITLINSLFYLRLVKAYWFTIPYAGIGISTLCYIVTILLIHL